MYFLKKMEKALNLQEEDMNRKHVSSHSNVFHQKARSLYQDFSKGSPETSDTKLLTANGFTDQEQVWTEKGRREGEGEREGGRPSHNFCCSLM